MFSENALSFAVLDLQARETKAKIKKWAYSTLVNTEGNHQQNERAANQREKISDISDMMHLTRG